MIITSKNFLDTVKIYDTNNLTDLNELNGYLGKYEHYYNVKHDMVLIHNNYHEVVIRAGAKRILCHALDAGYIYNKRVKRDETKLSIIFSNDKPINAMVKTNVPGFKQWCNVETRKPIEGGLGYKVRNKSGRALRITPLQSKKTGRVFTIIDKITAVKRV